MDMRRGVDIAASLFFMPAVLFGYAALSIVNRGDPLFGQERIGLDGKHFTMLKFRSMADDATQPKGKRITRIGKIMRPVALDEFPQFINILKGEMSLFGPRPLMPEYDALGRAAVGDEKWSFRYRVKSGLMPPTLGLKRLTGEFDPVAWSERDTAYVKKRLSGDSFMADIDSFRNTAHLILTLGVDAQSKVPARAPAAPALRQLDS